MSFHEGSNWQARKEDEGKPLYSNPQPAPLPEQGKEEGRIDFNNYREEKIWDNGYLKGVEDAQSKARIEQSQLGDGKGGAISNILNETLAELRETEILLKKEIANSYLLKAELATLRSESQAKDTRIKELEKLACGFAEYLDNNDLRQEPEGSGMWFHIGYPPGQTTEQLFKEYKKIQTK